MAQPKFYIPLSKHSVTDVGRSVLRVILRVEVQNNFGSFDSLPFRLDTGTDFMTIPIWMAELYNIPFDKTQEAYPTTVIGKPDDPSYLSTVFFSFPQLPLWQFRADCLFSPYDMKRCLLSLNNFVPHFVIRSKRADDEHELDSLMLQLRTDHGGQKR